KKFYVLILISVITIFGYLLINDRNRVKHQCYYNRTGELDNYIDISCCLESHGIRNDLLSEKVRDSIDLDCPAPSLF
ncbi:MAG: hypothetical protein KJ710_04610, partial [Candidatus Omnitrophica bacterium]|nr:hypothetical protein [Candidatus Omnitrophota bacterium]